MKRRILLIIPALALSIGLATLMPVLQPLPASAILPTDESSGSSNSGGGGGGSSGGSGSGKSGTGGTSGGSSSGSSGGSDSKAGSGAEPTGQETITDPALSSKASCDKDDCALIAKYLNPFIKLLTILVGIAITIGIIIGAIQVMSSAGDPQQAARGKDHIRNALFAAVGYVLLFALLEWIIPGGIA